MKDYEVVNYIEICGKDVCMDAMGDEELKKAEELKTIKALIQDRLMEAAGYIRKTV